MYSHHLYWTRTSRTGNLFLCMLGSTLYEISSTFDTHTRRTLWFVRNTRTGQGMPGHHASLEDAKKWCMVVAVLEMG